MSVEPSAPPPGKHGANFSPDAVAASLARGDGGFGREQQTYFDHPVVRKAHWQWEIVGYFYVGGIMSGSAILAALADEVLEPDEAAPLVRNGRWLAVIGSAISGVLLIKDLGRPERFYKMLRIVKLESPMSVGVWVLTAFSLLSGLALADQVHRDGLLPFNLGGPRRLRNLALMGVSALMGSYTGVLIAATAIPVWYRGRFHIPAIFVCSATATSCSANAALLAATGGSARTIARLEQLEFVCSLAELALLKDYERVAGEVGKPLFAGPNGERLRLWTELLGIAVPTLLNLPTLMRGAVEHEPERGWKRWKTLLAAGLNLFGGYVLRDTFIDAGRGSADDPRPVLRHPE